MSWDSYLENMKAKGVPFSAICGLDGSVWANSCSITTEEVQAILKGFNSQDMLQSKGVHVGGTKYMFLRLDESDQSIHAKKGPSGISVAKSKTCCVIGQYGEGVQPGTCSKVVLEIRDYLKSTGY